MRKHKKDANRNSSRHGGIDRKSLSYAHRKKHHKSFRVKHVGLLLFALVLMTGGALGIGVYLGKIQNNAVIINSTTADSRANNRLSVVKSSLGFSFGYDNKIFEVDATEFSGGTAKSVTGDELDDDLPIISANLKPIPKQTNARDLATRLIVEVNDNKQVVSDLKQTTSMQGKSDGEVAASLFNISSDSDFDVSLINSEDDSIDGVKVLKRTYQYTPKFGSSKSKVFSVQWTGVTGGRAFSMHLKGLIGGTDIPEIYTGVMDTFNLKNNADVLGLSTNGLSLFSKVSAADKMDSKYLVDLASPAVVKIYHVVCGTVLAEGVPMTNNGCTGGTGSGFFISSDGYIATNGHVVVKDAEDMFVEMLVESPELFIEFLRSAGYSDDQIAELSYRPDILASIIAKIYDLPADTLTLGDERRTYLVSMGNEPVLFEKPADVIDADKFNETNDIKKASLVGVDYSAKDLYVVSSGDVQGFTSSDVAILKINDVKSPLIKLSEDVVAQGQKINIVGFPGDAENLLTSNDTLSVSVTAGTISAVRDAAGGKYKLYQTDGDASHGNSGGPAIDENNNAIGVLTYRYKNSASEDAAKSYIRAIADVKALADDKNIELNTDSKTQSSWEKGLTLYSQNRFSKSVKEFEKVKELYPAHRLADSYIDSAKKNIADGKDVKDFPIYLVAIIALGVVGAGVAVWLIAKHKAHNQLYKMTHQVQTNANVPQPLPQQVQPTNSQQNTPPPPQNPLVQ